MSAHDKTYAHIFYNQHTERRTEASQDMLLFEINMGNMSRAKEFCEGDSAGTGKSKESWFLFFSLSSISAATDNFSEENKLGEGGFGPVYKVAFL